MHGETHLIPQLRDELLVTGEDVRAILDETTEGPEAQWRLAGGAVVRQGYPMLDGAAPLDPAEIVDHVRTLAFRYRFGGAWTDTWQGAADQPLPQAVELTLVRDDGVRFARKLTDAGVKTRHVNYPGMPHGFFFMPAICSAAAEGASEISQELLALAKR